jgi:hypothetical protein
MAALIGTAAWYLNKVPGGSQGTKRPSKKR